MNSRALVDGRFRVGELLGRGAMGSVFRATDMHSQRDVALKFATKFDDPTARQRFQREGQLTAALEHPGIVRVHSAGEAEGKPYLAYELVEGARTLDVALDGADTDQAVRWVRDAARALGHAHERGITHRDVKPGNLLIEAGGALKVADFGLATAVDLERLTRTGAFTGTPSYMAPEQINGNAAVTSRADVWALGVVLYEALCKRLPFDGSNLLAVITALASDRPPPAPASVVAGVPKSLNAVVLKALSKAPHDRYPDGDALADDLDRYLAGDPVLAQRQRRPWRRFLGRLRGGHPVAWAWLGVAACALVAVATFLSAPRVAARLLEEHDAWRRSVLKPWAFGLGTGPAPTAEALDSARDRLEWALRLTYGEQAARARTNLEHLRAHERLLAFHTGAPLLPPGLAPEEALVNALIDPTALLSTARALEREPPPGLAPLLPKLWALVLERSPSHEVAAEAAARVAPADLPRVVGVGTQALCQDLLERPRWRDALRAWTEAMSSLTLGEACLDAKARALEAQVPRWRPVLRAAAAPRRAECLERIGRVLRAAPRIQAPPALNRLCDDLIADALEEAKGQAEFVSALKLDVAMNYWIDPRRPLEPRLGRWVNELSFEAIAPQRWRLDYLVAVMRLGRSDSPRSVRQMVRTLDLVEAQGRLEAFPESSALRLLVACCVNQSRLPPLSRSLGTVRSEILPLVTELVLRETPDLSAPYVGEARLLFLALLAQLTNLGDAPLPGALLDLGLAVGPQARRDADNMETLVDLTSYEGVLLVQLGAWDRLVTLWNETRDRVLTNESTHDVVRARLYALGSGSLHAAMLRCSTGTSTALAEAVRSYAEPALPFLSESPIRLASVLRVLLASLAVLDRPKARELVRTRLEEGLVFGPFVSEAATFLADDGDVKGAVALLKRARAQHPGSTWLKQLLDKLESQR